MRFSILKDGFDSRRDRFTLSVIKAELIILSIISNNYMKRLTGLSACDGLAVGDLIYIQEKAVQTVSAYSISADDIQIEKDRLKGAIQAAQTRLAVVLTEQLTTDIREESPEQDILETQQTMLSDTAFIQSVYMEIENSQTNAERALKCKLDEVITMLTSSGDTYLSERAVDIRDAYEPVFSYLNPQQKQNASRFAGVPQGALLAAQLFKPSEALEIKRLAPCGIVMEEGSATCHIAIVARAWNIPTLVAVSGLSAAAKNGIYAVLDSTHQTLILEPDAETLTQIKNTVNTQHVQLGELQGYDRVHTLDGTPVYLSANITLAEDAAQPIVQNAAGIGLFRSEFLFLGKSTLPYEEEQYEAYCTVLKHMGSKPTVIRTFDAGADKMLKEQENLSERNALLGWRAIRYCLDRPEIFKVQLRALLRAGCFGNLHILLPMISCIKEITAVRQLIADIERECEQKNIPYKKNIPLGIMIEVPAAAVAADLYAPAVDFFSIGTNDLIQYTMAADRENQTVAHLADYFHPAVLRLIRHVIEAEPLLCTKGHCSQTGFVSMCGEMAACEEAVPLLLGMGLRRFSMAAQKIPAIAQRIATIRIADAQTFYESIKGAVSPEEIRRQVIAQFPYNA